MRRVGGSKSNQEFGGRFSLMFPFRVPLWVPIFHPHPYVFVLKVGFL